MVCISLHNNNNNNRNPLNRMKKLHECLVELAPYNIDFKTKDDKVLLGLEYKKGWQIIKPDNENIECFNYGDRWYYGTVMNDEKNIDDIFSLIKLTITYNQELEKKIELFRKKMVELQDVFAKEDYNDLLNLSFQINKPKKRKKKENVSKLKEVENNVDEINETVNEEIVQQEEPVKEDIVEDDGIKYVNTMDDEDEVNDNSYSVDDLNKFIGIS